MTGSDLRRRRLALRGANGGPMSIQELASRLPVAFTTLQRWETEKPRTELLKRGLDPMRVVRLQQVLAELELEQNNGDG